MIGVHTIDVASFEQIVQSANAVPTITVSLQHQGVFAPIVGFAVVFRQKVYQVLSLVSGKSNRERSLARLFVEIVQEQHRVIPPIVANSQNGGISARDHTDVTPADLRHFLAHPDNALGPIQHRVGIAALLCNIDMLVTVGTRSEEHTSELQSRQYL